LSDQLAPLEEKGELSAAEQKKLEKLQAEVVKVSAMYRAVLE
jgi:hypothetical protein